MLFICICTKEVLFFYSYIENNFFFPISPQKYVIMLAFMCQLYAKRSLAEAARHLTLGTEKAWITDIIKRFIAQPVKYTISQYPFSLTQDSRLIGWFDFLLWSCRWGSVVRWSVWGVRRQASLTVDRYSGHHARKSGLGHLSAVPNRIKILEISPHSQTEFAPKSARLTWQMGDY